MKMYSMIDLDVGKRVGGDEVLAGVESTALLFVDFAGEADAESTVIAQGQ